ncbi:Uncharacterized membrane protein YeaQ/YmgE, transglycosylase-associated protein family [Sporobacter termitidis DSM 10068]|uniref:Uncharacterized membrane protein YeaQ/YmgE, transglycosylase-associated protein family n=1 Tax=Sporobacter termitidis DSM 10068 TaxID=1123282 RepID=A0A1M5X081_9FIRM|nr:GlsB/YeaQ/YmgE family stress response membrane protein [Sporobacter termitidis]SHH93335.1 Uncharacterized membrane protein YeaQ/YmgE, transglycosylase-associated protein family [Sporobacter termitidis DSM 10068]
MSILGWVILGGIAGWIASIIMRRDKRMGVFANILVGIVGAFIGGFLFHLFGGTGITGFNFWSLVVATVGAVILLWIVNLASGSRSRST